MKRAAAIAEAQLHASRWIPLTSDQSLVLDIVHFARQIPVFPVERRFDLSALAAYRAATQPRISWSMIFLKAYALTAARHPALRRAFVQWPRPHLVEFPHSVGRVAIHREHDGDSRLCWASFQRPEERGLAALNRHLRWYQTQPVEVAFDKQVQFSQLPTIVRRLVWWWNLNVGGKRRASRLGTFSISSLAGQQALNRGHPSLLTTSLTYGPLDERGQALVTLLCDHRVLDGVPAAAALADLEEVLNGEICHELASAARLKAA
jgi:hypothetical protein